MPIYIKLIVAKD